MSFAATLPTAATGDVVFSTNGVPYSTNAPSGGLAISPATTELSTPPDMATQTRITRPRCAWPAVSLLRSPTLGRI